MPWLADSNILLRSAQPLHAMHVAAQSAVATLLARGETICVLAQNLIEFWVVATRPAVNNGLGMTVEEADAEIARIQTQFAILPDVDGVVQEWRRLVVQYGVTGVAAHDARIAAAMRVHGITHILTFDVDGFRRYAHVTVLHPDDVIAAP